jgi:hypothetical protein
MKIVLVDSNYMLKLLIDAIYILINTNYILILIT